MINKNVLNLCVWLLSTPKAMWQLVGATYQIVRNFQKLLLKEQFKDK